MFLGPWLNEHQPEVSWITEVANGPRVDMLTMRVMYIHYHFIRPILKLPNYSQVLVFLMLLTNLK
jgi:hypothetical protein